VTYRTVNAQTFDIVAARNGTAFCHLANGPISTSLPDC
jgi:hypothetical protein